ncbi:decapping endonuclease targeting mRNA [Coemansia sp. RSA 2703]|nr:decapping endonuclease targeting mRNA [Coemansia sp. RSA 2703]
MDDRELKYYHPPTLNPPPSLFHNFSQQIRRDPSVNEHIDGLLTAILSLPSRPASDFVMYRGMLTRIFVTPYSLRDAWSMNATRIGQTIYIEDHVTDETIAQRGGSSEMHEKLMYSGYKFETLCVVPETPATDEMLKQRLEAVVDTHCEYCSVFETQLGSHRIVSGAEIDCIDGPKPDHHPSRLYRELKTAQILDTPRKRESFDRFKLLKFWAQSFIAGIPQVTVGYRDSDGVLRQVEDIRTQDMPRRVRGQPRMWDPNVCLNFADQVLTYIKTQVHMEGPETRYRITYDPQTQEVGVVSIDPPEPTFLTADFLASLRDRNK